MTVSDEARLDLLLIVCEYAPQQPSTLLVDVYDK